MRFKKDESDQCLSTQKNEDTYLDVPSPIAKGHVGEENVEWKGARGEGDFSDFSKGLSLEDSHSFESCG